MTILGIHVRQPFLSDLALAFGTLCFVAMIYTSLHFWFGVEQSVLRKAFFIFGAALLLGPFGISPRQNGWRVLPIYFALTLFAITVL